MRGVILQSGRVEVRDDLPEPPAQPGETRVAVIRAGVCATDLALRRGYMGFSGVPGHEFVGRALEGPLAGRRVVGEINAAAGAADPRHVEGRTVLGILGRPGAFAERLSLPDANLRPLPDAVSSDAATFTEPLAAACEIIEQLGSVRGLRALVAGDGRLGLLCAHVLHHHGAEVTVAGRHAERQALLPPRVTVRTGLLEAPAPPGTPRDFDLAVEATGHPEVLPRLFGRVRPRGTIVLKTTSEQAAPLDLAPVVVDELTLLGSRCGPFAPALELLGRGVIPLADFVTARYDLSDAAQALEHAARPGALKVLIDIGSDDGDDVNSDIEGGGGSGSDADQAS